MFAGQWTRAASQEDSLDPVGSLGEAAGWALLVSGDAGCSGMTCQRSLERQQEPRSDSGDSPEQGAIARSMYR